MPKRKPWLAGAIRTHGGAAIRLSGFTVAETAAVADDVGTLSVVGATGTPTFTLVNDAGGKFALNVDGVTLEVAGALDYETATTHSIIVGVSGTTPAIGNTTFTITVTDIEESALGLVFSHAANSQYIPLLEDI